jgi:hypothetical protein
MMYTHLDIAYERGALVLIRKYGVTVLMIDV